MRVLGIDAASSVGLALYDLDKPPSAMRLASFKCDGEDTFAKLCDMRAKLPRFLREMNADFIAIEAPLDNVPTFRKQTVDPLTGETSTQETISAKGSLVSAELAAGATMIVLGFNTPCVWVRPQTWRTIIPKNIRSAAKDNKKAVQALCDSLRISGGNEHSRDAAGIALWASGHSQELKLARMTRQERVA